MCDRLVIPNTARSFRWLNVTFEVDYIVASNQLFSCSCQDMWHSVFRCQGFDQLPGIWCVWLLFKLSCVLEWFHGARNDFCVVWLKAFYFCALYCWEGDSQMCLNGKLADLQCWKVLPSSLKSSPNVYFYCFINKRALFSDNFYRNIF